MGDRNEVVTGIAIALDSTVPMIKAASAAGCNLLVTHHPPFWYAPTRFTAADTAGQVDGAAVYAAARAGVALLGMHTNVDCAPAAYELLLAMMGLRFVGPLQPEIDRLGQIAEPLDEAATLASLVETCVESFGPPYSVWGPPDQPIRRVAMCSGGASEVLPSVIKAAPDCFITGELAHHEHLYLADAGIALIELGHDRSEQPYCGLLKDTLTAAGYPAGQIQLLSPSAVWWTPGSYPHEMNKSDKQIHNPIMDGEEHG